LRASTFFCAVSIALEIQGLTIASPSSRFLFISRANMVCGPKMRSRSSSRLR
jgi:hypothetical protein